jgi:hypothetical protein
MYTFYKYLFPGNKILARGTLSGVESYQTEQAQVSGTLRILLRPIHDVTVCAKKDGINYLDTAKYAVRFRWYTADWN